MDRQVAGEGAEEGEETRLTYVCMAEIVGRRLLRYMQTAPVWRVELGRVEGRDLWKLGTNHNGKKAT